MVNCAFKNDTCYAYTRWFGIGKDIVVLEYVYCSLSILNVLLTWLPLPLFPCHTLLIDKELSYDHLASGLKAALQNDKSAFDADRLQKYTGNFVRT